MPPRKKVRKKKPPKGPALDAILKDIPEEHVSIIQVGQGVDAATLNNRLQKGMNKLRSQIEKLQIEKRNFADLLLTKSDEIRELRNQLSQLENLQTENDSLKQKLSEVEEELALWRKDNSNSFQHLDL